MNDPVVVVGAGIAGLTVAVTLAERGRAVTVVSDRAPLDTTSAVAGAVWEPHLCGGDRVDRWALHTYRVLCDEAAAGVPGVSMGELVVGTDGVEAAPSWAGGVDGFRILTRDERRPGWVGGHAFTTAFVRMDRYLPALVERAGAAGVVFRRARVQRLGDLAPAPVVVDCSGLGAAELVGDDELVAVRGQVVVVADPGVGSVVDPTGPYLLARDGQVVVGGTADRGVTATAPDPACAARLLAGAVELAPALRRARVLDHRVGLRPWRPEVRLGPDPAPPAGIELLVHDYGHGGAGVTLSWGCASEVADLLEGGRPAGVTT